MTKDIEAELEALLKKATPGPVVVHRRDGEDGSINYEVWTESAENYERHFTIYEAYDSKRGKHDAELYAAARNHLPSLLADLKRMREALEQCSAEWMSPPCTVAEGAAYLYEEFARRAEVARAALGSTG